MSKTDLTIEIENALRKRAKNASQRYAFEVPVCGGICDLVTTKIQYENHRLPWITCYEIKVSLQDYWNSKNGANFVGDENYYVMPKALYNEIILKQKQSKLQNIGLILYNEETGELRKKTDGTAHKYLKKLSISDKIVLMDTMLMRVLYSGK